MGILTWIILGLVAGGLAKLMMPGKDPGGCFLTMILGIVGAIVGGWVGSLLGFGTVQQFDFRGLLIAVLGAIIVLLVFRLVRGRK